MRAHAFRACLAFAWVALLAPHADAQQLRETKVATEFKIFAPPNNMANTRFSAVIVTAMSGTADSPTVVDLIDEGDDGDSDDTVLGATLVAGESLIRYIRDGAVNDDGGGVWDGDLFTVQANRPVAAYIATDSDWQHDWAPSDNGTLRGTRFFLYANEVSVSNRDIDVIAYEDGTHVQLFDLTTSSLTGSGSTTVGPRPDSPLLAADLDAGQDLMATFGLGRDLLLPGRTYELVATKGVTCLFGAIGSLKPKNQASDGGGFVPGASGAAADDLFYFHIPHNPGKPHQQELRIIAMDDDVDVVLEGKSDPLFGTWETLLTTTLDALEHADYVGGTSVLYRLTATGGKITAFEASWLETGSPGTSDVAAFAPGVFREDGSEEFLVYLGPPGQQGNTAFGTLATYVTVTSREPNAGFTASIADTGEVVAGSPFSTGPYGMKHVVFDLADYNAMNAPTEGLRPYVRIDADTAVAVQMANFNDNWMAYATAVIPRNPDVTVTVPETIDVSPSGADADGVTVTGTISHVTGAALTDVWVEVLLPAGFTYVPGSGLADGLVPSQVTVSGDGAVVRIEVGDLGIAESVSLSLQAQPTSSASAGEVVAFALVGGGEDPIGTVASSASATAQLIDTSVAELADLKASASEGQVTLTWTAKATPGSAGTMHVERSTNPAGPFTTLAALEQPYSGTGSPVPHEATDTGLIDGSTYYYKVTAVGPGGAEVSAGPVCAQPGDTTPPPAPSVVAAPGDGEAALTITPPTGPGSDDVIGYEIQRALAGEGWVEVTGAPYPGLTYTLTGLTNGALYYVRVQAVDDAGNRGAWSASVSVMPNAPDTRVTDRYVAFEDTIEEGENDWDYNDLFIRVQTTETFVTLAEGPDAGEKGLSRIVMDFEPLARGAGYFHALVQAIDLSGPWTAKLTRYAVGNAAQVTTTETWSGLGRLEDAIFEFNRDALPPAVGSFTNTSPQQAEFLPGASARLEVMVLEPASNLDSGAQCAAPYDLFLRLPYFTPVAEIHRPDYGGPVETTALAPELAGVPLDFVLTLDRPMPGWCFEGFPIWKAFPEFIDHALAGFPAATPFVDSPATGPPGLFHMAHPQELP